MNNDRYLKIILDNHVIAQGKIKFEKLEADSIKMTSKLISLDGKYFFHSVNNNQISYSIEITNIYCPDILLDENQYNLKTIMWQDFHDTDIDNMYNYDVFIEVPIDNEIINLINNLNNISSIKTTSSCCGHNIKPAYVSMTINNIETIRRLFLLFYCVELRLFKYWHIEFRGWACSIDSLNNYIKDNFIPITIVANINGIKPILILEEIIKTYLDNGYFSVEENNYENNERISIME